MAWSVTRYHGKLSEKTNDPILRKFSDGWTDGRTNIQTEESDFIGCCPTNVERPIIVLLRLISAKIANYDFMRTQYRRFSEPCRTCRWNFFAKIFNRFYFHSILDIWQDCEYPSAMTTGAIPKFREKLLLTAFTRL